MLGPVVADVIWIVVLLGSAALVAGLVVWCFRRSKRSAGDIEYRESHHRDL